MIRQRVGAYGRHSTGEQPWHGTPDHLGENVMHILSVDGLTLSFGGVHALRGVDMQVAKGSITAVIGPNGAGKTSLFNSISGFYRPQEGREVFQGADITRLRPTHRAALG
ncbi:MAG: ATP-binding cassette domain-containing protein, partial [Ectothiorhodospiraceae bacterium]|nr:ATP-binding cassette domain-containing protein [Ectothiorhodospiraceae bacterium]